MRPQGRVDAPPSQNGRGSVEIAATPLCFAKLLSRRETALISAAVARAACRQRIVETSSRQPSSIVGRFRRPREFHINVQPLEPLPANLDCKDRDGTGMRRPLHFGLTMRQVLASFGALTPTNELNSSSNSSSAQAFKNREGVPKYSPKVGFTYSFQRYAPLTARCQPSGRSVRSGQNKMGLLSNGRSSIVTGTAVRDSMGPKNGNLLLATVYTASVRRLANISIAGFHHGSTLECWSMWLDFSQLSPREASNASTRRSTISASHCSSPRS